MATTPIDDSRIEPLFGEARAVRAMLEVEAALARAQALVGVIPEASGREISAAVDRLELDMPAISAGTRKTGVPVVALVEQLRAAAGEYVHWGATSQDIVDTGLVLSLREALALLDGRLERVIAKLRELAKAHKQTLMVARTRSQAAVPTTFGAKVAGWIRPLVRHRERLRQLEPRLLVVQFGGAAGTLAALGNKGLEVAEALAAELKLGAPAGPWHTERDSFVELAGWLALVTGTLGKIGEDLILLGQTEVGEVRMAGGGSSTMPQKSNPVAAEAMVTAARMNATLVAGMHQAMLQEHERGGSGWTLEWLTLPQMAVMTGASLLRALEVFEGLEVRADRMRENLAAAPGVLAEAAVFALAEHMPRSEAAALVKRAVGGDLIGELRRLTDAPVDWDALADPGNYLGVVEALVERA